MKKEIKGFLMGTVITTMALTCVPSFAKSLAKSINVQMNTKSVSYNDKAVSGDNFLYNGKVYVELKGICTALGKNVVQGGKASSIIIKDVSPKDNLPENKKQQDNNSKNNVSEPKNQQDKESQNSEPQKSAPVSNDGTKPEITDVKSISGTEVLLAFSEKVDKASAENISGYSITQRYGKKEVLPVLKAVLDASGDKVTLTTTGQQSALYNIAVNGISDLTGSSMDKFEKTFVGMPSQNPYQDNSSTGDSTNFAINKIIIIDETSIKVATNKKLDKALAENASNYSIYEKYGMKEILKIESAVLSSDGTSVTLKTGVQKAGILYEVAAKNLKDALGNALHDASMTFISNLKEEKPKVEAVISLSNTSVEIYFNTKLDASAADANLYKIARKDGDNEELKVTRAELDSTMKKIILSTGEMKSGVYTIKVSSVKSIYGQISDSGATCEFAGMPK